MHQTVTDMGLLDPNLDKYHKKSCFGVQKKLNFFAKSLKFLFEILEILGWFFINFIELFKMPPMARGETISTHNYEMSRFV